jgi:MFS family permease
LPSSLRHNPSFRRFWMAQAASSTAYQILVVALGWHVYDLTHSAMSLGLIGLAQFLPQLLLTLPVGYIVDHHDRRRIALGAQTTCALLVAALALGSRFELHVTVIFACAALLGAARAFEPPAMQSLLPGLVGTASLPAALATNASARQTATIVGPALGGIVYLFGPTAAYGSSALLFFVASRMIAGVAVTAPLARREPPSLATLFGGIAFIRRQPVILGAISLDLFSVLLGGATALLPIVARDILATGPWGLGLLRSAPAVGALAMSLYLARHPLRRGVGRTLFLAVGGFGLATIGFGLSHWMLASLLCLVVLGATDMISVVVRSSLVQLETPDAMRGRVSAVNSIFIGTSNQLGEFESGLTAAWFGTVPAIVLGGVGTLLVLVLWARLFPSLRQRETLEKA